MNKLVLSLITRLKTLFKNGEVAMESQKKKMVIEVDSKDLETLQVMFGIKPDGELIEIAIKSFTGLLNLNKQMQAAPSVLPNPTAHKVVESPASRVYSPQVQPVAHSDKTSDGKPIQRHDSTGKPVIENQLITDPKGVSLDVQRELARIRKEQEERQKTVLANRRTGKSQPHVGGIVG